jgi:uncharacterized membrane protein
MGSAEHAEPLWPERGVGPIRLADALGWASTALGAPMTFAPRRFLRAIGVQDDPRAVAWTVAVGLREYTATANIIANRQRRIGMWSRVAGDLMDVSLLAGASRIRRADARRLLAAGGLAGGLLALDTYTAVRLSRAEGTHVTDGSSSEGTGAEHDTAGGPSRLRTAVTIRRPEEDVRRAFAEFSWSDFDAASLESSGGVRFAPAPGQRGTELHLDYEPSVPAGRVGDSALKLLGKAPAQRIDDELRRFKSLLETGVLARSETSPDGPSSTRQIMHKAHPAQPLGSAG